MPSCMCVRRLFSCPLPARAGISGRSPPEGRSGGTLSRKFPLCTQSPAVAGPPIARQPRPVWALVRLAWRADRLGLSIMLGSTVFDAAAAIGGTLAVGFLLNALVASNGSVDSSAWLALGAVAAIAVVQRCVFPFLGPAIESLEHRLTLLVRERVMAPLLRPATINHLEDPRIADELRMAQQVGSENFSAQQALGAFTDLGGARLAAVASGSSSAGGAGGRRWCWPRPGSCPGSGTGCRWRRWCPRWNAPPPPCANRSTSPTSCSGERRPRRPGSSASPPS